MDVDAVVIRKKYMKKKIKVKYKVNGIEPGHVEYSSSELSDLLHRGDLKGIPDTVADGLSGWFDGATEFILALHKNRKGCKPYPLGRKRDGWEEGFHAFAKRYAELMALYEFEKDCFKKEPDLSDVDVYGKYD